MNPDGSGVCVLSIPRSPCAARCAGRDGTTAALVRAIRVRLPMPTIALKAMERRSTHSELISRSGRWMGGSVGADADGECVKKAV
jgi:hypothetical protein